MHNNFYFLRQLTQKLAPLAINGVISECFSQDKDELVIRIERETDPLFIRASVRPDFGCVSFPSGFARARKNSVDLFDDVIGRRVQSIRQFQNERSFALQLSGNFAILFKMHGNRANILVFEGEVVKSMFRNSITADMGIRLDQMDREIDWSVERFHEHAHEPASLYFTFGKVVWEWLTAKGFNTMNAVEKWNAVQSVIRILDHPPAYYLTVVAGKPIFSLLNTGQVEQSYHDPIEAINAFYGWYVHRSAVAILRASLLRKLKSRLEASVGYCDKTKAKLTSLESKQNFKHWADLLMANLHQIKGGENRVTLADFYNNDAPIEIPLKSTLTPQANAAMYYRKAKNQRRETEQLKAALDARVSEMAQLRETISVVESAADLSALRRISDKLTTATPARSELAALPYHEFVFRDFRIWVGKNAQSNDILTLKLARKDDLWLHARDVAGSHVIIKQRPGVKFSREVVEYAAEIAAYYSKRKNESLCPVVVTPRKFVRKRKGDPPGMVVVDREEVVMVTPQAPSRD